MTGSFLKGDVSGTSLWLPQIPLKGIGASLQLILLSLAFFNRTVMKQGLNNHQYWRPFLYYI